MSKDSIKKHRVQVDNEYKPPLDAMMRLEKQGKAYAVATHLAFQPKQGIKKLSRDKYALLNTGEVKEFNHEGEKQIANLRVTFDKLRGLIRTNFTGDSENQLFITLTYAENMTDRGRLYTDFKKFMMRLREKYSDHNFEYIVVAEPQGRGAWHMHLMLKTDKPVLYIDNKLMAQIWRHGFTETERLKSDDVGSYYVAYFTDLTTEAANASSEEKSKKRKKGERLSYYPVGFKFYRTSRGIKKPEVEKVAHKDILAKYGEPVHDASYQITDQTETEERFVNAVYKATYKRSSEGVERKVEQPAIVEKQADVLYWCEKCFGRKPQADMISWKGRAGKCRDCFGDLDEAEQLGLDGSRKPINAVGKTRKKK